MIKYRNSKFKVHAGDRFGRLTVVGDAIPTTRRHYKFLCRCDCGVEKFIGLDNLRYDHTHSCGCLQKELVSKRSLRHGESWKNKTREWKIWTGITKRCTNQKTPHYHRYGGRGIRVCERWQTYENFLADMGRCPDGYSIDRRNNDGDYEPGNCRWATPIQQGNNTRRNHFVEYAGLELSVRAWERYLGVKYGRVSSWLRRGGTLSGLVDKMITDGGDKPFGVA